VLILHPHMIYDYGERRWNDTDRGNRRYRRKTCPYATLFTTNPIWTDQGANTGLRGERLATNQHGSHLLKIKLDIIHSTKVLNIVLYCCKAASNKHKKWKDSSIRENIRRPSQTCYVEMGKSYINDKYDSHITQIVFITVNTTLELEWASQIECNLEMNTVEITQIYRI
jgi:hypothetical protein